MNQSKRSFLKTLGIGTTAIILDPPLVSKCNKTINKTYIDKFLKEFDPKTYIKNTEAYNEFVFQMAQLDNEEFILYAKKAFRYPVLFIDLDQDERLNKKIDYLMKIKGIS